MSSQTVTPTSRALARHHAMSRLTQYAASAAVLASHEWVAFKNGKVLRVRRTSVNPDPTTPLEQYGYLSLIGVVSESDPKVSPIGNYVQAKESFAKAKYSIQVDRPSEIFALSDSHGAHLHSANNQVLSIGWDTAMGHLHQLEGQLCNGSVHFFGKDSIRLSKKLFEDKGDYVGKFVYR